jgi:hypothetical protein
MAGTITEGCPTPAERTATRVQDAARGGLAVMIPGAFEARPDRSGMSSAADAPWVAPPASRRTVPRRSVLERIWRYIMRPTDTPPL